MTDLRDEPTMIRAAALLGQALHEVLFSGVEQDAAGDIANVTDGLFAIARSLSQLARAVDRLGNADASTPFGAIEGLGIVVRDAGEQIAGAIASRE